MAIAVHTRRMVDASRRGQGKLPCPRSAKPHDADDLPAALRQCSGALLGRAPAVTREPPQRLGEANLRGRPRCTHARHRTARRLSSVDAAGQLAGCCHTGARGARKTERGRRWRRHDPEALLLWRAIRVSYCGIIKHQHQHSRRCSYAVRTLLVRARTHPRTTRRARLPWPLLKPPPP